MADPPMTPPAGPPMTPPANPPGNPPANPPPGHENRPDWLPEQLWSDKGFNSEAWDSVQSAGKRPADLPSAAAAYKIPEIEGFDGKTADASPLFGFFRDAAFSAGVGQGQFDKLVGDYVSAESKRLDQIAAEERGKLGERAQQRIDAVNTWLTGQLGGDELDSIVGVTTSATGLQALERLMNARATSAPRDDPPPPPPKETEETIRALMSQPAYYDDKKRDPVVVKRVQDWYEATYGKEPNVKASSGRGA